MTGFRTALAFLTRLPGGRHPEDTKGLTRSVGWFPTVGIVIGAIGAGVFAGASELLHPLTAAVLAFVVTAMATGGFHEDGLADSVDALAGGWTVERRLEILKDSRHGTFGVLSLVLITMLKVSALAPLSGWNAALALVCAHSLGRAGAVGLMAVAPTAREDGLGADYTRTLHPSIAIFGVLVGVATAVVAFGVWAPLPVGLVATGSLIVGVWAWRRIGGVTGDLLGAAEQVGEAAVLIAASAVLI